MCVQIQTQMNLPHTHTHTIVISKNSSSSFVKFTMNVVKKKIRLSHSCMYLVNKSVFGLCCSLFSSFSLTAAHSHFVNISTFPIYTYAIHILIHAHVLRYTYTYHIHTFNTKCQCSRHVHSFILLSHNTQWVREQCRKG